jgi:hypothetical protein
MMGETVENMSNRVPIPAEWSSSPEAKRLAAVEQELDRLSNELFVRKKAADPDFWQANRERYLRLVDQYRDALDDYDRVTGGPPLVPLSETINRKLNALFSQANVGASAVDLLLRECGVKVVGRHATGVGDTLDEVRWSVLEGNDGNLERLKQLIDVAKQDWREVWLSPGDDWEQVEG